MRIAQISPLFEAVPPKLYGGTERVVYSLTEELVAMGHDVTLFASGDSITSAKLAPMRDQALRLDPTVVDWIAVYDMGTDRCYYVPSWMLGDEGRSILYLRLVPTNNGQSLRIRRAEDYLDPDFSRDPSMEPAGFEPAASSVQGRRSAN